jgi:hypothetical protein
MYIYIYIYVYNGGGRDLVLLHSCDPAAPTTTSRDLGAQVGHVAPPRWGASPDNHHDGVLLREWGRVAPLRSFIGLGAPGK